MSLRLNLQRKQVVSACKQCILVYQLVYESIVHELELALVADTCFMSQFVYNVGAGAVLYSANFLELFTASRESIKLNQAIACLRHQNRECHRSPRHVFLPIIFSTNKV